MPTVEEYTDPYLSSYTFVPPTGPGICSVCHVAVDGWSTCWSCNQTEGQVSRPARLVVPVSLYQGLSPLWVMLRNYKDGRTETVRDQLGMRLSATLGRFIRDHESCMVQDDAPFDVVTTVPSSKRAHPHPMEATALRVKSLAERYRRTLEATASPAKHNAASDQAFDVIANVRGARVLLLDDTFTSGAALQSAATALHLVGAADVAAVTAGRYYNRGYNDLTRTFWETVRNQPFSFDACCLETASGWVWPPPHGDG
jgi:predicted amidophosphoribosyltransferase